MSLRKTIWTGVSSYGQLVSLTITTLLSVPLALRYLSNEEFGLWSFASQALGYLMLIDLGISGAISRLMADPLNSGHQEDIDRWFTLSSVVLLTQAALLLAIGLPAVNWIVRWFDIPTHLQGDASRLLTLLIGVNAVAHPFRICAGILYAQNRAYAVNAAQIAGTWLNLGAFATFLFLGFRSSSYGLAAAATAGLQIVLTVAAVARGPHRFHLCKVQLWSAEARELFRYSSGLAFVSVGVQVVLISQSLILTKFAGLAAVASFNVSTRAGMLLMQLLWRPFDSFAPRWQQFYVNDERPRLGNEFLSAFRLTLGLTFTGAVFFIALNPVFVRTWAHADLYLGRSFDLLVVVHLIIQTLNHCLSHPFILAKNTRQLAVICLVEAPLSLAGTAWAVQHYGPAGLLAASILLTILISLFWIFRTGPLQIGITPSAILSACKPIAGLLIPLVAAAGMASLPRGPVQGWVAALLCVSAIVLFTFSAREELNLVWRRLSSARQSETS